jgi:hypothetical protein
VSIDSPPSHRAFRFLIAMLIGLSAAIVSGVLYADHGLQLIDAGKQLVAEVRAAWQS